jgi:hypothetical protein
MRRPTKLECLSLASISSLCIIFASKVQVQCTLIKVDRSNVYSSGHRSMTSRLIMPLRENATVLSNIFWRKKLLTRFQKTSYDNCKIKVAITIGGLLWSSLLRAFLVEKNYLHVFKKPLTAIVRSKLQ